MLSPTTLPAASRRPPLIGFVIAVAALYFGKEILIPLALAILLAFLLTPPVRRLEKWKLPRTGAVLVILIMSMAAAGGVGYVVANQLLDVINQLPSYKANI